MSRVHLSWAILAVLVAVASAGIEERSSSASISASRSMMSRSLAISAKAKLQGAAAVKLLSPENFDDVVNNPEKFVIVLFYAQWSARSNKFIANFVDVAEELSKENPNFVFAALDAPANEQIARQFKVMHFPQVVMVTRGQTEKTNIYHPATYSHDEFSRFVKHVELHERFRYLRQQNEEEEAKTALTHPGQGTVVELNYTSFEMFTKSFKFFTFVTFYANWCGACKNFMPELIAVSQYFKTDPHVIIARVNADEHPKLIERYKVAGLPTSFFFPKARLAKRGIKYEGAPERHDMQAAIDTHNRMADHEDMPYIDENTDLVELARREKEEGKDPESLLRNLRDNLKAGRLG